MRRIVTAAALALLLAGPGCASGGSQEGARRSSATLEAAEIQELRAGGSADALTLIERARPTWLRMRPHPQTGEPMQALVFYNGQRMEWPRLLRGVPADRIVRMRFHTPAQARGRWGTDGEYGVIEVEGQ